MKYELTLDQWLDLHTLIGTTQGTLSVMSGQCKNDDFFKYMCAPIDKLNDDWEVFIKDLKETTKTE